MLLSDLQLDRNLTRQPNQTKSTSTASYLATNPTLTPGNNAANNNAYNAPDSNGASQVITGAVITSCIIQTSAAPDRAELVNSTLSLYDDTYEQNGTVIGTTGKIFFTHDLNSDEGFIMEKRASIYNTYDNVLSLYALPSGTGNHNYMFIGRNATLADQERNVNSIHFSINKDTSFPFDLNTVLLNGIIQMEYSENSALIGQSFLSGNSEALLGEGFLGYSTYIIAGNGGRAGIAYFDGTNINEVIFASNSTTILPGATGIDLGSPSNKFSTFYGTVAACSLPTVENALQLLEKIPAPALIGDRGHFGKDKIYFDDQTFPDEITFINSEGNKDIEMTRMIGFLLKTVIELNDKIKILESNHSSISIE